MQDERKEQVARPLAESDASGNITDEFIFFGGKRVARRNVSSSNIYYYFADHLGTSRVVTSATGAILDDSDFYPFGGERPVVSSSGNNYKFTGKERDPESGADYLMARYYSSSFGRFLSPDEFAGGPVDAFSSNDPIPPGPLPYADIANPQSLNKYAYVHNNPLRYIDPTGHLGTGAVGSLEGMYVEARRPPGADPSGCALSGDCNNVIITGYELTVNGRGTGIVFPSVAAAGAYIAAQRQERQQPQLVLGVTSDTTRGFPTPFGVVQERDIDYTVGTIQGQDFSRDTSSKGHTVTMSETQISGNDRPLLCSTSTCSEKRVFEDQIRVSAPGKEFTTRQQFYIDGRPARVYNLDKNGKLISARELEVHATSSRITIKYIP